MDLQHAQSPTTVNDERPEEAHTRLHRRWLVLVRIICIVLLAYTLGFFGTGFVLAFVQHRTICTGLMCVLSIPEALVYFAVASVIFWRKPDDWMALFVALMLVLLAPISTLPDEILNLLASVPVLQVLLDVSIYLAFASFLLFWFLFPNGRFWPRWTAWLVIGYLLWLAFGFNQPSEQPAAGGWFLLDILFTVCMLIIVVLVQVIRYLDVSNPVERQQTKWAIVGTSIAIWAGFVSIFFTVNWTSTTRATLLLIPLSIGIAVLRYRLYDIDVIIRRTLVYSILTVILALLYGGLVIGLESLVRLFTGQVSQSPVIIVASTLAIAALFQPLRHRIQRIIDRRFYRRKYDAARTLEAFSATLRQEVDLDQLCEQLLAVVQETMQPAHVSLWLRKPEQDGKRSTANMNAHVSHSEE